VILGDLQPFEDVVARLRLAELELRPTPHDVAPNSTKLSISSSRFITFGRPADDGEHDDAKASCNCVCLYRLLRTTSGTSPRFSSMTMRMPSRSDSSRRSAIPVDRLVAHEIGDPLDQLRLVEPDTVSL